MNSKTSASTARGFESVANEPDLRVDYVELSKRVKAVAEGEGDTIALMATLACEVHHSDTRFDWTGFIVWWGQSFSRSGLIRAGTDA